VRPVRTIVVLVFAMVALIAAPAWAAPVALQVSPSSVAAGDTVTLSGSVGSAADCAGGVTLLSKAFVHTHDVAGVPAVDAAVKPDGTFTTTTKIPTAKPAGTYTITGRCGGGNLGASATLTIQAAPVTLRANPNSVAAGQPVVVSGSVGSASDCTGGVTLLSKAFVHTHDFAGVPAVDAAVKPDGTFSATTKIPSARAAGTYTITGRCGGGNLGAAATLVVRAVAATTTAPATTAPATTTAPTTVPSVTQPQPSAVTAPPTQPAAQPANRWLLPGLAAVAAGILAGLGVWLLYRRRNPTDPSQ
jgi:hypothetical protein